MKRYITIALLAILFILVFSIIYLQFLAGVPEGEPSVTGRFIGFSPESATTLLALLIVFLLVWFTWKERE